MSGLRSMVAGLAAAGTGAVGVQAGAFDVSGVMERFWSGESFRAWLDGPLWSVSVRASGVVEGCEAARVAVSRYVGVLEEIGPQYVGYRDRLRVLSARAAGYGLACHRDGAGHVRCTVVGLAGPGTVTAREVEELESDATWAVCRIDELVAEREAADRRLVDELAAAVPAGWAERRAAYAAIGVLGSDDLGAGAVGAGLAAYLGGEAWADGRLDAAEVEHVLTVLGAHGGDEALLKAWVRELGPGLSMRVLEAAGTGVADRTLDPVQGAAVAGWLRLGVSVASRDWTTLRSGEFAQGLVEAARVGGDWSVLGYLFDDPVSTPMGRGLTVAMAGMVDELERTGPWAGGRLADAGLVAAGVELTKVALGASVDAGRVREPAGAVLQTLGLYPQDAADWLTDTTPDPVRDGWDTGQARVDYWFQQRDWSQGDGFAGVAGLWAGAQHVPGGPSDTDVVDERAWQQVATLNTWVFDSLADNPSLRPQHVSATAGILLTEAVGTQLPYLVEYPLDRSTAGLPADSTGTDSKQKPFIFGSLPGGPKQPIGDVQAGDLGRVVAMATFHPQGAERFERYVAAYQGWVVDRAVTTPGVAGYDALERVVLCQALLDAGPAASGLVAAGDEDDARRKAVADVTAVLGAIPIGGGPLRSYLYGSGLGTMGDQIARSWADEYQGAVQELPATREARAEVLRAALYDLGDLMREAGAYHPRDFPEQADDVDDLVGDWGQTFDAVTGQTVLSSER
ncbi:hypothetical protein [Cellulosimicrobium sp. NPDC055967]|uniref:hypothetical protein n=1 Tax=Cellulosimicrobium sp. NPDC055967 TaxID=3345670 RepID=UPI0035DA1405